MVNPNLQQNGIMVDRAMTLFRAGEIEERVLLGDTEKDLSFHSANSNDSFLPYVLFPQRLILSVLAFKEHRSALQRFQAVPLTDGNIEHQAARAHINGIREVALLVVEVFFKVATKA